VKRAQSAIGNAGDVKLIFLNLLIAEQLVDKRGKHAVALFEK
jgi:hypothetical protein